MADVSGGVYCKMFLLGECLFMLNGDIGRQLGNYRLLKLLGQGGFADVYLGEQIYLKTSAAIKVLRTQLSDDVLEQFVGEARTIARLVHPNIISVLDFGIDKGIPFLIMPYAQHGSLRKIHPRGQVLPLSVVVSYSLQVAQALQHAHDHKIIHRDVKPENILLGDDNLLKLSDFGIATTSHSTYTQPTHNPQGNAVGTTTYMAPEQFTSEPSFLSDQYALGVVVYEWLCGRPPFVGADVAISFGHVYTPTPSLHDRAPQSSPAIERVVQRALAKEPHMRFPRVIDFADELAIACAASPFYSSDTALVDTSGRKKGRSELLYSASASTFVDITADLKGQVGSSDQAGSSLLQSGQHHIPDANVSQLPGEHATSAPVPIRAGLSRRAVIVGATSLTMGAALGLTTLVTLTSGVWQSRGQRPTPLVSVQRTPTSTNTTPTPVVTSGSSLTPAAVLSTTRPTVTSWGGGQYDLFVRGTDNALWQRHFEGSLHNWASVTGSLFYDPTVISWGANRFDLFVRALNNSLQHQWFDGSWHTENLPGKNMTMIADVAATSWGPGRLDVFICGSDNALWHRYYDGSWHDWEALGGVFSSAPTAVATGINSIDVFLKGSDNALWNKHFDGTWHDWLQLGGHMTSDPVAVYRGSGQLDVFARGTDNTLQHIWYYGGKWQHWESLGGSLASAPGAISWDPSHVDVFARSFDNTLQHMWLTDHWHPWQPFG